MAGMVWETQLATARSVDLTERIEAKAVSVVSARYVTDADRRWGGHVLRYASTQPLSLASRASLTYRGRLVIDGLGSSSHSKYPSAVSHMSPTVRIATTQHLRTLARS